MQISKLNANFSTQTHFSRNKIKDAKRTIQAPKISATLMNNSLNELMGKTQVLSFKGTVNNSFDYSKSNYHRDDENNASIYEIKDSEGKVIQKLITTPELKTLSTLDGQNNLIEITESEDLITTRKTNSKGEEFFFEELEKKTQTKVTVETDSSKGRRIVTVRNGILVKSVEVEDLKTGEQIYSGPLVHKEVRRNKYRTDLVNILTGEIVKKEIVDPKEDLYKVVEYSEKTQKPTRLYVSQYGRVVQKIFDSNGTIRVNKAVSKDKLKSVATHYDKNGNKTVTIITNGADKQKIYYSSKTKDLKALEEVFIDGKLTAKKHYDRTGSLSKVKKYGYTEKGVLKQITVFNADNDLKEKILFFKDGKSPHISQRYRNDGTYVKIVYDIDGNIASMSEHNSDGSRIIRSHVNEEYRENEHGIYDLETNTSTVSSDVPLTKQEKQEVISRIHACVSNKKLGIEFSSKKDIEAFAKIIGINSRTLLHMDKKTFRTLCKKYHPDIDHSNGEIFSIINNIYRALN